MGYWSRKTDGEIKKLAREAIKHQDRKKLEGLATAIADFKKAGIFTEESYRSSKIPDYIQDTFGLCVSMRTGATAVGTEDLLFAGVVVPEIDRNNPIVPTIVRWTQSSRDLNTYLKLTRNRALLGVVDVANAKVSGGLSKLVSTLYLTTAMFTGEGVKEEYRLTDIELAAVICHELGHIFSYFENIIAVSQVNVAVASAVNCLMNSQDDEIKLRVLSEFEKHADIKLEDKDTIISSMDKDGLYTHIATETLAQQSCLIGSNEYREEQWERASDAFATRLGGGAELTSALVKFHRSHALSWYGDRSMMSTPAHIAVEVATYAMMTAVAILGNGGAFGAIFGAVLGTGDPSLNIHGTCEERFRYIRQQMVDELKMVKNDKLRKKILEDISRVDGILVNVNDKRRLIDLVYEHVLNRKSAKGKKFNKELESLMYNELFVSAHKMLD